MKRLSTSKMKKQSSIMSFDLVDKLREYLDDTTILEEVIRAMSREEAEDILDYIARNYGIDLE